jgi:hypothetical protein
MTNDAPSFDQWNLADVLCFGFMVTRSTDLVCDAIQFVLGNALFEVIEFDSKKTPNLVHSSVNLIDLVLVLLKVKEPRNPEQLSHGIPRGTEFSSDFFFRRFRIRVKEVNESIPMLAQRIENALIFFRELFPANRTETFNRFIHGHGFEVAA